MDLFSTVSATASKVSKIGKSKKDKQAIITVAEVWNIWDHLSSRYDIMELTNILLVYAKDEDMKLMLMRGTHVLKEQSERWEKLMIEYGIPMPDRPAKQASVAEKSEIIDDKYIFRRVFAGIQTMLPKHMIAFSQSVTPHIRNMFKKIAHDEMDLYDKLMEYGKMKGYLQEPPVYRI